MSNYSAIIAALIGAGVAGFFVWRFGWFRKLPNITTNRSLWLRAGALALLLWGVLILVLLPTIGGGFQGFLDLSGMGILGIGAFWMFLNRYWHMRRQYKRAQTEDDVTGKSSSLLYKSPREDGSEVLSVPSVLIGVGMAVSLVLFILLVPS